MDTFRPSEVKSGDLAGAPEIEITAEMLQAGVDVLWSSGAIDNPCLGSDRLLVKRLFLAMTSQSPSWLESGWLVRLSDD